MLAAWENEEIVFSDDGEEINNKEFWYSYKKNNGLRWIAKFFMGRPPTQCEDERHFSRTGITVSHRRARMCPENVERNFILSKVLQFFGFVLYPGMDFSDCTPNKLFRDNDSGLPFLAFTERMFKKWLSFKLSAAPAEPDIEESSADVTDLMSAQGDQFEVGDSDSEDEDLEFIDSFL